MYQNKYKRGKKREKIIRDFLLSHNNNVKKINIQSACECF